MDRQRRDVSGRYTPTMSDPCNSVLLFLVALLSSALVLLVLLAAWEE